ncbi:MAG: hypothetical protein LBL24_07540 [Bacteroidales bacterium]|jgi:hypothetical protein|nr:hypothetical protein [Bacteroidales bacterium]
MEHYKIEIEGDDTLRGINNALTIAKSLNIDSLPISIVSNYRDRVEDEVYTKVWVHKDSNFLDIESIARLEYDIAMIRREKNKLEEELKNLKKSNLKKKMME